MAGAIRANIAAQSTLRDDITLATKISRKLFSPAQAEMIADLISRDLPFYDLTLPREFVSGMNQVALDLGILSVGVPYEQVVATQSTSLWSA